MKIINANGRLDFNPFLLKTFFCLILNKCFNAQLQRLELEMKLTDIETESCAQIDKKIPLNWPVCLA